MKNVPYLIFIAFFLSVSYANACLPQMNSIRVTGPSDACFSESTNFNIEYRTSINNSPTSPNECLTIEFQGVREIFNFEPFGLANDDGSGNCFPSNPITIVNSECTSLVKYDVDPFGCIGGFNFDVLWDPNCPEHAVSASLGGFFSSNPITSTRSVDVQDCFTNDDESELSTRSNYISETSSKPNIDFSIEIYPNPAKLNSSIQINLDGDEVFSNVRLLDLNGKILREYRNTNQQLSINTTDLIPNMYIIQAIAQSGKVHSKKFIIN